MTISLPGLGLVFSSGSASGGAPVTYTGPAYDDFAGSAASITNRATTQGGLTWGNLIGGGSNSAPMKVDGSGFLSGGQGTSFVATFDVLTLAGAPTDIWRSVWSNPATGLTSGFASFFPKVSDHVTYRGSSLWDRISHQWTYTSGNAGALRIAKGVNIGGSSGETTFLTANGIDWEPGDVYAFREWTNGSAHLIVDVLQNGQYIATGGDITAAALSATPFNYGHNGGMGQSVAANSASLVDQESLGDPTSTAMLSVLFAGRVVQGQADGSINLTLWGDYTQGAPSSITYTIYDASTNLAFGAAGQTLGSLTTTPGAFAQGIGTVPAGAGSWSGKLTIPSASQPASMYIIFDRGDIAGGGHSYARTPVFRRGDVVPWDGQSNTTHLFIITNTSDGPAQPANAWQTDGGLEYVGGSTPNTTGWTAAFELASRTNKVPATSGSAQFATTYQSLMSSIPVTVIRGGNGLSYLQDRWQGGNTGAFEGLIAALKRNGGDFAWLADTGLTNEINQGTGVALATGYNDYLTLFKQYAAFVGHDIKVMMLPVGAVHATPGAVDGYAQTARRISWQLAHDFATPTIMPVTTQSAASAYTLTVALGPDSADLDHFGASTGGVDDGYHTNSVSNVEISRRAGQELAYLKGGVAGASRRGPQIDATAAPVWNAGAKTVAVTYNLNGFDSLSMVNSGVGSEFRGGTRFWDSSANIGVSGHEFTPTAVSVGSPSGGKVVVTWTFTSISGAPFVTAVNGANPFNPSNNSTVNSGWAANAVILAGVKSGENNVAQQALYIQGGPDGIQAQ